MQLSSARAEVFVPDGLSSAQALPRTTHLGIGAHPDDLEFMTWHGILSCLGRQDRWFSGVIVTDGAQSPRGGPYAGRSDDEMRELRLAEQKRAATLGEYGALVYLGYSSATARQADSPALVADLAAAIAAAGAEVVYTHNLFDGHDTHVAVAAHAIRALRSLPHGARPRALYGCEVWGALDWLTGPDRVTLDASGHDQKIAALMAVYESQIAGGKNYDQAAAGRKRANATFDAPHAVDRATAAEHAIDLTPLIADDQLDLHDFATGVTRRFGDQHAARLRRLLG